MQRLEVLVAKCLNYCRDVINRQKVEIRFNVKASFINMSLRNEKYPLYQKGNPQLRIFLPNFFMKLVKDTYKVNQLPNMVAFHVSMQMTEHDIKNYLERIYDIPVVEVRTEIRLGEFKRQPWKGYVIKEDDFKVAYVTLPRKDTFQFPNLFPKDRHEEMKNEMKSLELAKQGFKKIEERNKYRPGLPGWFSF